MSKRAAVHCGQAETSRCGLETSCVDAGCDQVSCIPIVESQLFPARTPRLVVERLTQSNPLTDLPEILRAPKSTLLAAPNRREPTGLTTEQ